MNDWNKATKSKEDISLNTYFWQARKPCKCNTPTTF